MDSALPFNLDITNPDGNSFVTWILVTNDGRTQLDGRPHGDALVLEFIWESLVSFHLLEVEKLPLIIFQCVYSLMMISNDSETQAFESSF